MSSDKKINFEEEGFTVIKNVLDQTIILKQNYKSLTKANLLKSLTFTERVQIFILSFKQQVKMSMINNETAHMELRGNIMGLIEYLRDMKDKYKGLSVEERKALASAFGEYLDIQEIGREKIKAKNGDLGQKHEEAELKRMEELKVACPQLENFVSMYHTYDEMLKTSHYKKLSVVRNYPEVLRGVIGYYYNK